MSIIYMVNNDAESFPDGAFCSLSWTRDATNGRPQRHPIVLAESHKGLCVREREMNGYDDSDFYMTVWNPVEKSAHEIQFATTRGWSYPCFGSAVDAPPEIMAEYEAWTLLERRRYAARYKRMQRKAQWIVAKRAGIGWKQYQRLDAALNEGNRDAVLRLLNTKKFRSEFRAKLCAQVREWLADPAPKYRTPLSPKQLEYI